MNDRDRQLPPRTSIGYLAVSRAQAAVDFHFVPPLRVPHIGDAKVVLFGPEKWDSLKNFSAAKNVTGHGLSLTPRYDQLFTTAPFACQRIWPPHQDPGRQGSETRKEMP